MHPPAELDALRTFTLAARYGSFAQAASALNLSDSAVSHQLRKLSLRLGFPLFERHGRAMRMTTAAASLLAAVEPALRDIDAAILRLGQADGMSGSVRIVCAPMFAQCVLARHVADFATRFPSISVHVLTVDNPRVIGTDGLDVGVVFGPGDWPGLWQMRLAVVRYAPVCAPDRLRLHLECPDDLVHHVIIHNDDGTEWRRWFERAGLPRPPAIERALTCNDVAVALELARRGAGITLASDFLAAGDLEAGALIRPFAIDLEVSDAWYLVAPPDRLARPRVRVLIAWLADVLGLVPPALG